MQTQSVLAKSKARLELPTDRSITELPPLGTLLKIKRIRASDGDGDDGDDGIGDTAMQGCTCTSYG